MLAKKDNLQKKILKTTHLVSSQMHGSKYDAAKKWNLPIVSHEWLRECFRRGEKLPVDDFLLEKKSAGRKCSELTRYKV